MALLRQQYHARPVGAEVHVWDVIGLLRAARGLPVIPVPLDRIAELDELWWYQETQDRPTPRSVAAHMRLVAAADLSCPILLCAEGRLMDGMHRAVKALIEGRTEIGAIRFPVTPPADFVNVSLDTLPYAEVEI